MIQYKNTPIFLTDEGRLFNKALKQFIPDSAPIIWYDPITGDNLERPDIDSWIEQNSKQVKTHDTPHALSNQPQHAPLSGKSKEEKITALKLMLAGNNTQAVQRTEHANTIPAHANKKNEHAPLVIEHAKDKAKQRNAEINGKFKGFYLINKIKYSSAREAALANDCSPNTVIKRCKEQVEGYKFIPMPK